MSKKNSAQKDNKEEKTAAAPDRAAPGQTAPEQTAPEQAAAESSPNEAKEGGKEQAELEKALAAAEDYKRKWYSVSAEYDNFRKRTRAAVSEAYRDGAADAVMKLLPVADNFGYALGSAQDERTKAGIDKVIKSFASALQSLGIEEIPVNVGDKFDESVAEAVTSTPCAEGETPNTVKFVLKKGYRSGEKVIRYAQVSVTV